MQALAAVLGAPALLALFFGGSVLILVYILRLLRTENEAKVESISVSSATAERKKDASQHHAKSKKKNWVRSSDKQTFSSPWLLKTLKNHTGQVLHIDYSSTGKYLASCGEELDMSTSGSESSKNTAPPSTPPKGLSRRQRKNRRREDSPPDAKKKPRSMYRAPTLSGRMSEYDFYRFLRDHLLQDQMRFDMGYPDITPGNGVVFYKYTSHPRRFLPPPSPTDSSDSESSSSSSSGGSEPDVGFYGERRDEGQYRLCVRCGRGFFTTKTEYLTQEHCIYHWGRLRSVLGQPLYSCCGAKPGAAGCSMCKLHVWNGVEPGVNGPCDGYVRTRLKKGPPKHGHYGVYAVDCEMCYTVAGLELTKVTIVGMYGRLVYEAFVRPTNEIVDYNTRFSGITPRDLKGSGVKTLDQVQNDLRGFINAETILIGHGLENDLRALKLLHRRVVDTACSFPHYHGYPYKCSLKSLAKTFLKRDVQVGVNGHNSYEDACASMDLMLYLVYRTYNGPL